MNSFFPSFLKEEDNVRFLKELPRDDIYVVLQSFKKYNSHGMDGSHVEFLLGFYKSTKDDLMRVIKESKSSRNMLVAFNDNCIAIIPKKII
jgi:hypothetical protein